MEKILSIKDLSVEINTNLGIVKAVRGVTLDINKKRDNCNCWRIRMW